MGKLRRYLAHFKCDKSRLSKIDHEAMGWVMEEERKKRQEKSSEVTSDCYDLVTLVYEQGWYVHGHPPAE